MANALNMPKLTLWYAPGACSLATHIALRETGLPFELINASINDPQDPAHLPNDFRKINPKKRVPVLAIDEEIITEAPAILLAISTLAPDLKLFGSTNIERIRIAEWLNWLSGTLHSQSFGAFIRPARYSKDEALHPALQKQAQVNIAQCFAGIEGALTDDFAVGNAFTVVDVFLFPFWRWGKKFQFPMENEYPRYTAHVTRTRDRKSTQAALKAEGIAREEFGISRGRP